MRRANACCFMLATPHRKRSPVLSVPKVIKLAGCAVLVLGEMFVLEVKLFASLRRNIAGCALTVRDYIL